VTKLFKKMLRLRYESAPEIDQAAEWPDVDNVFWLACESYVSIAIANREEIAGDLYSWVKEKIEADQDAICVEHFRCHRQGWLAAVHGHAWRAIENVGWINLNSVWWVFNKNIERGVSLALENAAIKLAGTRREGDSEQYETAWNRLRRDPTPVRRISLSDFEATVGPLMVQARQGCATKYLPKSEVSKIAEALDKEKCPVRSNLERESSRRMAEYNQTHPNVAIKTWTAALNHAQFRGAVRKRFSRAEEKYRRATHAQTLLAGGSPRTTT
jgi:hypothetical protein